MGLELTEYLRYAGALFFVLALIGLLVWALRRFGSGKMSANGRGRRLAVTEAAMVDKRRRLVLIRRDNQEHLVMIGGPQDLVIETGITPQQAMIQDAPQTQTAEAPPERPRPPEEVPRPAPRHPETRPPVPSRPRTAEREPMPERPPRPVRMTPPQPDPAYSDRQPPSSPKRPSAEQPASSQERRSLMNVRPGETR